MSNEVKKAQDLSAFITILKIFNSGGKNYV